MHLGSAQPEACASRVLPPEVLRQVCTARRLRRS